MDNVTFMHMFNTFANLYNVVDHVEFGHGGKIGSSLK